MSKVGCSLERMLRFNTITIKGSRRITLNSVDIEDVFEGRFLVPQMPDFTFGIITDKLADAIYIEYIECRIRILMENGRSHYLKEIDPLISFLLWDIEHRRFELKEEEKK